MLAGLVRFHSTSGNADKYGSAVPTIFIDRDPDVFHVVLSYLRTNEVYFTPTATLTPGAVAADAEYYGLHGLVEKLTASQTSPKTPAQTPSQTRRCEAWHIYRNQGTEYYQCQGPVPIDPSAFPMAESDAERLGALTQSHWIKLTRLLEEKDRKEKMMISGKRWVLVRALAAPAHMDSTAVTVILERVLR
ncbi:hypothetical protein HK104_007463 [Borealophlyctis nickersoniae]|nr:hypothetical protein HK104_007463 [Borealophlyctis nickersoniae]